jgi:dolichol-phosphate mannosyltransferase
MKTLVVVPTYNERDNLPRLLPEVLAVDSSVDILVVDDGSPDGTGRLADEFAAHSERVHVLHRSGKLGLGTAYIAGFRYALTHGYDAVVEMDADFSHRPADLPRLLAAAAHADVVVGSRNVPGGQVIGWSPLRHVISKGGSLYARIVLGMPIKDCTGGFKCFRRRALEALDLAAVHSNGYGFQVEINYACHRAGMRFAEVPIVFPDRERGKSKMSKHIVVEAAGLVLRLRTGLARPPLADHYARPAASLAPDRRRLTDLPLVPGLGLAAFAGAIFGSLAGVAIEAVQKVV